MFGPVMNMVNNFGYAIVAFAGGWMTIEGMISVGLWPALWFMSAIQQAHNQMHSFIIPFRLLLQEPKESLRFWTKRREKAYENFFPEK
jgi:ATP-binding cassette subfamily B protein